jgi:thiol-disulfide isomerase/thioredoxin
LLIGGVIGLLVGTLAAVLIATTGTNAKPAVLETPGGQPRSASIGTAANLGGRRLPTDAYNRLDGGTATLARYEGTPLVVNVWSSTCPPCKAEMPAIESVHDQLGNSVHFVGLDYSDSPGAARAAATTAGVTYDILLDPADSFITKLGIAIFPTTLFVGANGTVVKTHAGAMSETDLMSLVHEAFGL